MCMACKEQGIDCDWSGPDCLSAEYGEFDYLSPEEVEYVSETPAFKEVSMSKKTEVEVTADNHGIITKQSEVYVWNDQVFASYKSALIALKKDRILKLLIDRIYTNELGYSPSQRAVYLKTWSANPQNYNVTAKAVIDVITELLAE